MGALCKAVVEHRERATQEAAEARANRTGTGQGAKSRAAAAAASRAGGGSLPSPEEMRQQEMEQQQAMQDRLVRCLVVELWMVLCPLGLLPNGKMRAL